MMRLVDGFRCWIDALQSIALSLIISFSLIVLPNASNGASKEALKLLQLEGIDQSLLNTVILLVEERLPAYKETNPTLSDEAILEAGRLLEAELTEAVPHLLDSMASTYDQQYTRGELAELIAFLETSLGKKYTHRSLENRRYIASLINVWFSSAEKRMADKMDKKIGFELDTPL